jgi:membrane fusion protein, multidrug efflux system
LRLIVAKTKVVLVILTLALSLFLFKHNQHGKLQTDDVTLVEVSQAKQSHLLEEAQAIGSLVSTKSIQITPEIAGQVAQILVADGVYVRAGTPIIQLNDDIYQAKLESANAQLKASTATFERMQSLAKRGIVSPADLEKAQVDFKMKKAAVAENKATLAKMLLLAPFDGVVGKVTVSPGEHVVVGQAIVSLTDIEHLRVEYCLSDKYLTSIKLGQTVTIIASDFPGKKFTGKVSYIAPTINTQDRTIAIYAAVPNEDHALTAGMFVNVTQALGVKEDALMIPAKSLVATIDGYQVYKVVAGKANAVPIITGQHTLNDVQVLQGLTVGDNVIITGQQKIRDGSAVKIGQSI